MAYYIHYNTKNRTWLERSVELKNKGIKNNDFFLRLYDKDLMDINPHDPNINADTAGKVLKELMRNPWYYYREIVKFPVTGGTTPLKLDLGTLTYLFLAEQNFDIIRTQSRQTGKTYGALAFYSRVFIFIALNSTFIFSTQKNDYTIKNIKKFKGIVDELPFYLKPDTNDASEGIHNHMLENVITMMNTPSNPTTAESAGRSLTSGFAWFDEIAFLKYCQIVYEAATYTLSAAKNFAKENGAPYGITWTTTPNDLDSDSGKYVYDMIQVSAKWHIDMFDWSRDEIEAYINANSGNDYIYMEYHWRELGYDDNWYREQCRKVKNNMINIKREIEMIWTFANDESVITEEEATNISKSVIDINKAKSKTFMRKFTVFYYEELDDAIPYCISCDIGGGIHKDSTAFSIIHPITRKLVGVFSSAKILIPEAVELIYQLLEWLPNAFASIERNNQGLGIIQTLQTSKYQSIHKRLFYNYKENEVKKQTTEEERGLKENNYKKSQNHLKVYGIDTTPISRDYMFDIFFDLVMNRPDVFVSSMLFAEVKTLIWNTDGKIEARKGSHDDIIMSFLIGQYTLKQPIVKKFLKSLYSNEHGKVVVEQARKYVGLNKREVSEDNLSNEELIIKKDAPKETVSKSTGNSSEKSDFFKKVMGLNKRV